MNNILNNIHDSFPLTYICILYFVILSKLILNNYFLIYKLFTASDINLYVNTRSKNKEYG